MGRRKGGAQSTPSPWAVSGKTSLGRESKERGTLVNALLNITGDTSLVSPTRGVPGDHSSKREKVSNSAMPLCVCLPGSDRYARAGVEVACLLCSRCNVRRAFVMLRQNSRGGCGKYTRRVLCAFLTYLQQTYTATPRPTRCIVAEML